MSSRRRSRRRFERKRVKERRPVRRLSMAARLGLVAAGALAVMAGIFLLAHGSAGNAERLGRISGILILLGLVCIGAGALGRL